MPPAHGYFDVVVKPSQEFADGLETLRVDGDLPIEIESVSLVGDSEIEFLGAMVAPPNGRTGTTHIVRSWPPVATQSMPFETELLVDAVGSFIEPFGGDNEAAYELFVGMRIDQVGEFKRDGIRIDYRVGDKAFTAFFPAEAQFCVLERGRSATPCEP